MVQIAKRHFSRATLFCGLLIIVTLQVAGAMSQATAQQNPAPKIEQKDFVKKLDDVRNSIERDRNTQRPATTTDHVIPDVCKRNPQLPQCKLNQ